MAEIIGGFATSHVPAVGAAIDKGKQGDPYWAPYFAKLGPAREWITAAKPDACIVIYNDHATAFALDVIPTFAIGLSENFPIADEGFGPRPVPVVPGHPDLAWHLAESLILDEFDMTMVNAMPVDHGVTVPMNVMFGSPSEWPTRVVPLCVNVVQYPPPTGRRCFRLGQALSRAVESFPGNERVLIVGTGGMSHQLQGQRAGLINEAWDLRFIELMTNDPEKAAGIEHIEYLREAGSEGIELVMWLIMRGALHDTVEQMYSMTHRPTSNTHNGLVILENRP
jgi:protocatechuate 4,5-dioxygenase, beta chain